MQQHMKILSGGDKKHKCQYCGKDFLQLSHMRQHLRTHVGGKDFKCDHCPKAFRQKSHLLQHMRMHTGDKKYTCEICQRKFTQLSHLQQHIRTHTGDKPYKCSVPGCVKAFSQLSNLQSHSRIHQSDKPYKCNACYKCFSDEAGLLEHIPKHRESKHLKTHICSFCGKSYTQEAYLNKHMSKHADKSQKGEELHHKLIEAAPIESTSSSSFFIGQQPSSLATTTTTTTNNNPFSPSYTLAAQDLHLLAEPNPVLNPYSHHHAALLNEHQSNSNIYGSALRTGPPSLPSSSLVHQHPFNPAVMQQFYDPTNNAFASKSVNNEELLDP